MLRKIGFLILCCLFITCERPLVETNPLHGLELELINVVQNEPGSNIIIEASITAQSEILDYGSCYLKNGDDADISDIQHSIEEFESFWDTAPPERAELNLGDSLKYYHTFSNLLPETEYLFASYAKVLINDEEIIVYSNGIKKTTLPDDPPNYWNCVNSDCVYVSDGSGYYSSQ